MYYDSTVTMLKEEHGYGYDETVVTLKKEELYEKCVDVINYKLYPKRKTLTISHPTKEIYTSLNILHHFVVWALIILKILFFILLLHLFFQSWTDYVFLWVYHLYLSFFEGTPEKFFIMSILGTLGFLTFVSELKSVLQYSNNSRCRRCGAYFACKEFKKPEIRDVSTGDSYYRYFTSYWKCKKCHHERKIDKSLKLDEFTYLKGNKENRTYKCSECQTKGSLFEWKNPDVKEKKDEYIKTTRYYKCSSCGCFVVRIIEIDKVEQYNVTLDYKSRSWYL